mgnify:FL=1
MKRRVIATIFAISIIATLAACGGAATTATEEVPANANIVTETTKEKTESVTEDPCIDGHAWVDATCTEPKTCSICGVTEGEALGHEWLENTPNYQQAKTCSICGETEGKVLIAIFESNNIPCSEKMDSPFDVEMPTYSDPSKNTAVECCFSNYDCFLNDENHEEVDGYVWQKVTFRDKIWDSNGWNYGFNLPWIGFLDYYEELTTNESDDIYRFSVNFMGKNYDQCIFTSDGFNDSGWPDTDYAHNDRNDPLGYRVATENFYVRVPLDYDGIVFYRVSPNDYSFENEDESDEERFRNASPEIFHAVRLPAASPN